MSEECHCGKDGHPLHSVNCPVHGTEEQTDRAAMYLYHAIEGYNKTSWTDLPRAVRSFWISAACECLNGAEVVRKGGRQ